MDDAAIPEPVVAAWQRCVDGWDEPARHDALLAAVVQHNCFAWAAARYKTKAGDPVADARLARLRRAAEAALLATATVRPEASEGRSNLRVFALAMALLVAIAIVTALVMSARANGR